MNIEIHSNGVWYHGSDQVFDELRPESTITQWRELAEAFSHQPTSLWYDDDGVIHHNGTAKGYLYTIDEPIEVGKDIYRHKDTGRWFAVFIVKDRQVFGLPGSGDTEIVSFKIKDPVLTDLLAQQPGYLRGYPSSKWNWLSAVLDGTIPFEDICRWINMSYEATKAKPGNKKPPLPKLEISG